MTAARTIRPDESASGDDVVAVRHPAEPFTVGEHAQTRRRLPVGLGAGAPAWTWVGVVIIVAGFILIAVAWGETAGETQVHLQLPYVVSAGLVGLGLVMVGLTVINLTSRHRDGIDRDQQIAHLARTMDELAKLLKQERRN